MPNPLHAAAALVASFHAADGHVAVAGFYDNVLVPTAEEKEEMGRNDDPKAIEAERVALGLEGFHGEAGWRCV